MVKIEKQKVLGANSYVCRSYWEKNASGAFLHQPLCLKILKMIIFMNLMKKKKYIYIITMSLRVNDEQLCKK